ncbi:CDGSH iron-sulfur domain-containing protein [soil metagenome]
MSKTKLTVLTNGSLKVEGDFEIVDAQGNSFGLGGRTLVSLCRCGLSKNKPFCDGSHKGYLEHTSQAFDLPPKKV